MTKQPKSDKIKQEVKITLKKGDILYKTFLSLETARDEKVTLEVEEWHVTSVNKNGVYLVQKIDRVTYGKLSSKNGDYGFFDKINPIFKDHLRDGDYKKRDYHKTKLSAYNSSMTELKRKQRELSSIIGRVQRSINKEKK